MPCSSSRRAAADEDRRGRRPWRWTPRPGNASNPRSDGTRTRRGSAYGDQGIAERMLARAFHGAGKVDDLAFVETGHDDDLSNSGPSQRSASRSCRRSRHRLAAAFSSAAALRIKIPVSAARPVPTMTAVGVARPMAHGQAMMTTAMNEVRASVIRGSGPATNQIRNVTLAVTSTNGTKTSADPIGQALDRRLRPLGSLDHRDDRGENGVATDAGRAHDHRTGGIHRRADELVPRPFRDRKRLAGQHRFVDRGLTVDDDSIDRDPFSGPDPEHVADPHRGERDIDLEAVLDPPSGRRLESDQSADRAGRLVLGAGLEPATEQNQADDDRASCRSRSAGAGRPRG